MNTLLMKSPAFEPQFLFVDKDWIASKIREGKSIEEKLNTATDEVRKIFEKPLSDDELKRLMTGKYEAVISLLKNRSGFPNADDETFFKISGIDHKKRKNIIDAFNKLVGTYYRMDEFEIKDGRFILSQETIASYENIATYHTKCEKANVALEVSKNLCEALNTALKYKLIFPDSGASKGVDKLVHEKVISVKDYGTRQEKSTVEFIPNYKQISAIREKEPA